MALSAARSPESVPVQSSLDERVTLKTWTASATYYVGDIVQPSALTNYFYVCTVAGAADSTEPTWTVTGATISDNAVTWQYIGRGYAGDPVKMPNGMTAYIAGLQAISQNNPVVTFRYTDAIALKKATGTVFANGVGVWYNIATGLAVTSAPTYGWYVGSARGYWGSGVLAVLTNLNAPGTVTNGFAYTGNGTITGNLTTSGNGSFGGTLTVTGASTVGVLTAGLTTCTSLVMPADRVVITSTTLTSADSGKLIVINTTTTTTLTLPATAEGLVFDIFILTAAGAGQLHGVAPASVDKIMGKGITASDNKALQNTQATAAVGDGVRIRADGADGYYAQNITGTWARES